MTTTIQARTTAFVHDLEMLRNAQTLLTAAIQHAHEESLEPGWRDQLLGLRLRLEKASVTIIGRELDQMDSSQA